MHAVLEELDRVLLLGSNEQLLSYDTTFELGDFLCLPTAVLAYPFQEESLHPCLVLNPRLQVRRHSLGIVQAVFKTDPSHPQIDRH